jgi:hypothetical protein
MQLQKTRFGKPEQQPCSARAQIRPAQGADEHEKLIDAVARTSTRKRMCTLSHMNFPTSGLGATRATSYISSFCVIHG